MNALNGAHVAAPEPAELVDNIAHDDAAERAVLGACMASVAAAGRALRLLDPTDFYQPGHEHVFVAIRALTDRSLPCDPVSVVNQLRSTGDLTRAGGPMVVHDLYAAAPAGGNVDHHAGIVHKLSRQRSVVAAAYRLALAAGKPGADVEALIDSAHNSMATLRFGEDSDALDTLLDLDEFVSQDIPPVNWVIPGLLATDDRLIMTGAEGLGKSTLIRQIAVAAAAGVHPFTLAPCAPRRVLVVDVENPLRLLVERFGELRAAARAIQHPVPEGQLWIDRRPDGMNLANREDQRWLAQRVEAARPDLLVIGPAYKLYRGGAGAREEETALDLAGVLDEIRTAAGCALILEAHSPHAPGNGMARTIRPFGSSLWMRWPEMGFGLRLVTDGNDPQLDARRRLVELEWFKKRVIRPWPDRLEIGDHGWPWVEARPV